MWVGKFALTDSGEPMWIDLDTDAVSTVTGAAFLNGAAYDPEFSALLVTSEAVDASDAHIGGFRYRADGALRVVNADAGVPAGANTNQGIALSEDGQLCYVTLADTAYSLNGVAVDGTRRVYAAPLTFALEFADLGAGVVDTAEAITGATPTFTRATAATTVLSTGLIGAVASGDPRSYYDPTTLEYLGYLAEGARTNLCLQSEALDVDGAGAPWTNTDNTVTADQAIAPDGATTADEVQDAVSGAVQQAITISADVAHTGSVFVKSGGITWFKLFATSGVTTTRIWFNLSTGVVGTVQGNAGTHSSMSGTIKEYPGGWFRCTYTITIATDTSVAFGFSSASADNSNVRNTTSPFYLWGAQWEQSAAFASSYIPTTTLAVARNADVLTYPTTGWLSATAGTVLVQAQRTNIVGITEFLVSIDDGTLNERQVIFGNVTVIGFRLVDGGSATSPGNSAAISANTTFRVALTWAVGTNQGIAALNGSTTTASSPLGIGTVTTMHVGADQANVSQLFGPIRRVAYYAARLANATLQGLTRG